MALSTSNQPPGASLPSELGTETAKPTLCMQFTRHGEPVGQAEQVLQRAVVHVLTTFGFSFAQTPQDAQIVITSEVESSHRYLRENRQVIQVCRGETSISDLGLPGESLKRDPEFAARYRTVNILSLAPEMFAAIAELSAAPELPARAVSAEELGLPSTLSRSALEGKKILVLDDSPLNLKAAEWQFGGKNEVSTFGIYQKAAEALQADKYDIVLLDLLMPPEKFTLGERAFAKVAGSEFAAGGYLSWIAAANGAKEVIVITDTSHHDHPATALLDFLWNKTITLDQGATVVYRQAVTRGLSESQDRVKDWAASAPQTLLPAAAEE